MNSPKPLNEARYDTVNWRDHATCLGVDPDIFFPHEGPSRQEQKLRATRAKTICAACPVADYCFETALRHDDRHGVWGGVDFATHRNASARRKAREQFVATTRHVDVASALSEVLEEIEVEERRQRWDALLAELDDEVMKA